MDQKDILARLREVNEQIDVQLEGKAPSKPQAPAPAAPAPDQTPAAVAPLRSGSRGTNWCRPLRSVSWGTNPGAAYED